MGDKSLLGICTLLSAFIIFGSSSAIEAQMPAGLGNLPIQAHMLTMTGANLSEADVQLLEQQIKKDPHDVIARTKLLGYYSRRQFRDSSAREAKQNHILWLIQNAPGSEVLGIPAGSLDGYLDAEAYLEGKKIWIDHIEKDPENLQILENSAAFFTRSDRDLAEQFLKKGRSLDPKNPKWPQSLGHLYQLDMMCLSSDERKESARCALEQFEMAYNLSAEMFRGYMLQYLAKAAMEADELEKADGYAQKMLGQSGWDWNHGNNIHHGNIILGRIALKTGNIEKAKEHLIAAGKTPGSPQLNSFGPNMMLAKELAEKGEKEVVLQYFELCSSFWKTHTDDLDAWTGIVKNGGIPDFGGNLSY